MKDRSETFRGACTACECAEYELGSSGNKCTECGCAAAKHREEEFDDIRGINKFTNGRLATFALWILCGSAVAFLGLSARSKLYRFDRDFAPLVYLSGMFTFFWVFIFSFVSFAFADQPGKRAVNLSLTLLNFTVMSVYVLHYYGLTPYMRDELGFPVDFCRYVEWFFDMENLVVIIGFVCQVKPELVERAVLNERALTILGFIGSITTGSVSQWMLLFSYGTHCIAVQAMWDMYTHAIDGETDCQVDESVLATSRFISTYAWHLFALVHALVRFEFITFAQGEFLYFISHVFAKIPLTLFFMNASMESPKKRAFESAKGPLKIDTKTVKAA